MFILYQKQDDDFVLTAIAPQFTADIEATMLVLPDRPWKNHIILDDEHPIVTDQIGSISVGDWEDADTITRTATAADIRATKRRVGEFRDFMKMFSSTERRNIVIATQSDPDLKLWYDTAMGGPNFSLDHPDTTTGLTALVTAGLLTQERMDTILDGDFSLV
jgi:hypothetical protein